jgi:hypothetical protein
MAGSPFIEARANYPGLPGLITPPRQAALEQACSERMKASRQKQSVTMARAGFSYRDFCPGFLAGTAGRPVMCLRPV